MLPFFMPAAGLEPARGSRNVDFTGFLEIKMIKVIKEVIKVIKT